jgi:hypothetical protein
MTDYCDFPDSSPRRERSRWSRKGLVDDVDPGTKASRQLLRRFGLEGDESVGKFEGGFGGGVRVNVAVHVGAGQCQDKRSIGMCFAEADDRGMTASRVERDEYVRLSGLPGFGDADPVAEVAEDA